jgi:AcrR family transcriptional regulator
VIAIARVKNEQAPRETLNRERVLHTAMELADERGIDAVTMRELGRRLGVEAASLYNHVSGKDDVLNGLAELAIAEIDVPDAGADWKGAMRRRAISARGVFSRHPWSAALIDSRNRTGPSSLSYVDRVLGLLISAGFSPALAANGFLIVDSFIYGFERQQSTIGPEDDAGAIESAQEILEAIPEGAYPNAVKVAMQYAETPFDQDAAFELGLGLILDGLERRLASE